MQPDRRRLLSATLAAPVSLPALATATESAGKKLLRFSFPIAETGFDPAQINDLYSAVVNANIFDAPLRFDYLARPAQLRSNVAAAMPEVSSDFRTITVRLQPGIFFSDDPAFNGQRRELVAQDFVYALKRHFDPKTRSPTLYILEKVKPIGLAELRAQAQQSGKFEYTREVEGLRALDRYTFQFKLSVADPRFIENLALSSIFGAVAREVVEYYGDEIMAHPVGTGAYRLVEWRRSSRIVLERNPGYREDFYDEQPNTDDEWGQQIAARFKGRRLPMVDRVEISIIEEAQPRWLSFLGREQDLLWGLPIEFANIALPNGKLAPHLVRRGIALKRMLNADVTMTYFNMQDPLVGGYTPERVALRRAVFMAADIEAEIRIVRRGQAIAAQGPLPPLTSGYDPDFRTEAGDYNLARAQALLDTFGYIDRDDDGWREQPDGSPLILEYHSQPDQISRQFDELWQRNMKALGIRMQFRIAKWPEQFKQARAGKLMIWALGDTATIPDGDRFLSFGYGPDKGTGNFAFFDLPAYNALYLQQKVMPDGAQRFATMRDAVKLLLAYAPYKFHVHRIINDLTHPWVIGYQRHPFQREFWKFIDVDAEAQARAI